MSNASCTPDVAAIVVDSEVVLTDPNSGVDVRKYAKLCPCDAKIVSPSPRAYSTDTISTRVDGVVSHPVKSVVSKSCSVHM